MEDFILIRGARQHNLKNINVQIPKNKLVVFTGISGSGKSSLAFDTIFAEGQRRYVESLSSYARQFLGVLDRPDVDQIQGLSPAISIGQKEIPHSPRSTVGTVTEIYDYLRLLFARVGHPHCSKCGREISTQTPQQIVDQIEKLPPESVSPRGVRLLVLAPLVKDRKGEYSGLLDDLRSRGFSHVRIDGRIYSLEEELVLIRTNRHTIEAVIDRLVLPKRIDQGLHKRLTDSVETALKLGNGQLILSEVKDATFEFPESPKKMEDHLYSELFTCPYCNISLPELEPRFFSFNSPHGACPQCEGLGTKLKVDPKKVLNPRLSINEGGIFPWGAVGSYDTWRSQLLKAVGEKYGFSLDQPIGRLPQEAVEVLLFGAADKIFTVRGRDRFSKTREYNSRFEGVVDNLERRYKETTSDYVRSQIEKYMKESECSLCKGTRLKKEALSVTINGENIAEISHQSIDEFKSWLSALELSTLEREIGWPILRELDTRVKFLLDVGLEYLTLDRKGSTLAVGEAQRIRLASQIGTGLSGVLYVLDEPSIGLHWRDHARLLNTLIDLKNLGNTIIVVEHDPQTISKADWIIDFGPGAGDEGGKIVAVGPPEKVAQNTNSITGQYLSKQREVKVKKKEGKWPKLENFLILRGCQEHNLKNIDVRFPLGNLICVTGVSGSGKSTLVMDTLYRRLASEFYITKQMPGKHSGIEGLESIDKVINIDQSPIGRTPRSNSATYTGVFTPIRDLFAQTPEAKARGYKKGRFSFNVKGGRCENCRGRGQIKVEMQFLPDVYVNCETCQGKRFNRETLEIEFKGKNIDQVFKMSVKKALEFFHKIPDVKRKLETLSDVGLGYIKLGQPAPTLSGGEAQRVKLARELSKKPTGGTVYILDEPTTGLHSYDIEKLLAVLQRLVEQGNTVIVIEHNMDVIKSADWIIDLGPEGGGKGGKTVAEGTIDDIIKRKDSYTGKYLRLVLEQGNSNSEKP